MLRARVKSNGKDQKIENLVGEEVIQGELRRTALSDECGKRQQNSRLAVGVIGLSSR